MLRSIWRNVKIVCGFGRGELYADEGRPHLRIKLHGRTIGVIERVPSK